jgi:hypothetical protein
MSEANELYQTDWYLIVTMNGTGGAYVEAYGPFSSPTKAAEHVDPVIRTTIEIDNVQWSDIELMKFEVIYEFRKSVIDMTENEEIIKPPAGRQ